MISSRRMLGSGFLSSEDCDATGAAHTDNSNERTRRRGMHIKPSSFTDTIAPIIIAPMLFYTAEHREGERLELEFGVHPTQSKRRGHNFETGHFICYQNRTS
jgi:hypothetical protein